MRRRVGALALAALGLLGCTGNLADIVAAQGASVRSSYVRINSIYVNGVICGTGQVDVTVTCNADGMRLWAPHSAPDAMLHQITKTGVWP